MVSYQDISQLIHDINSLVKSSKDLELREKVFELSDMIFLLREENTELKQSLNELKSKDEFSIKMKIDESGLFYWIGDEKIPYCLSCWELDGKRVHMCQASMLGWICPKDIKGKQG